MPKPAPTEEPQPGAPRGRGRPRIHADDAARSRAYRARKAARDGPPSRAEQRIDRLTEDLLVALTEVTGLRARVLELEQLVADQDDELRRYRQAKGRRAER